MRELILFFMCFVLIFIIYQLFIILPAKRRKKNKSSDKELLEIRYLEYKYNLDLKKIKYNQLLQICALVSSFDISLTVSLVCLTNSFLIELLVGFGSILLSIFVSYHFVYLFYKKKGMIKSGKHK